MIAGKSVTVYDWEDFQSEICSIMGITIEQFWDLNGKHTKGYNPDVGYCNLWHVALETFIPSSMTNDSTKTMFAMSNIEEWEAEYIKKKKGWAIPMFHAYNQIMKEIDPNDGGVQVKFCW